MTDLGAFRAGYSQFLRPDRVLLTGHSHQAWPDAVRGAMQLAFDEAAEHVDDKWGACVFPRLERVQQKVLQRLGFAPTDPLAIGSNTHELVVRLLSCLPSEALSSRKGVGNRAHVVTTTGEFHSLTRQLRRMEEEGLQVTWVAAMPRETLAARLSEALSESTALLAFSGVLFEDAFVMPNIDQLIGDAARLGALVLVDAYHAFNVVPLEWGPNAAAHAYVVAGGYKYAQFGEGLCFMRTPPDATLRPVNTGWFADFAALERPKDATAPVGYGQGGARFMGSTFDPTAVYRAEAALAHFDAHQLDVDALRAISVRQTGRLIDVLNAQGADVVSRLDPACRGGFVAVRVPGASDKSRALRKLGVFTDARGDLLRLGPAPYLTDEEIDRGVDAVRSVL